MKALLYLSLLLISSCKINQENNPSNDLYIQLLEEYVKQDSIVIKGFVSNRLRPYKYYNIEYYKGTEVPQPLGGFGESYVNEQSLIRYINRVAIDSNSNKYFSSSCDSIHLKHQIILSSKLKELPDISIWSKKYSINAENLDKEFYIFYIPLFNCDSTQVYLQYDYNKGIYGQGNGAVFEKQNNKWKLVKWISRWIT